MKGREVWGQKGNGYPSRMVNTKNQDNAIRNGHHGQFDMRYLMVPGNHKMTRATNGYLQTPKTQSHGWMMFQDK